MEWVVFIWGVAVGVWVSVGVWLLHEYSEVWLGWCSHLEQAWMGREGYEPRHGRGETT